MKEAACTVAVCVPAPYLAQVQMLRAGSALELGAQDLSQHEQGAYTGEVSAAMLKEFGVRYAIVGHSERRQYHGETDAVVAEKAKVALAAGITPIVCVGETLAEREAGRTEEVVKRQMAAVIHTNGHCISEIVVAYEPVWAIGTGRTATPEQAQQVHALLRAQLKAATEHADRVRILYGGSMNAANAASLLAQPDIDGGLIGGASLKAPDFLQIIAAAALAGGQVTKKWSEPEMNVLLTVVLAVQMLTALGMIGLILDPAWQGRRHGRGLRQRQLGQPVRRQRQREFPVAHDSRAGGSVFRLHADAGLLRQPASRRVGQRARSRRGRPGNGARARRIRPRRADSRHGAGRSGL